ncbi:protein-glutamate O-methyltransferase CheR [Oceanobacter sp. 5_MG-2023]|jgi:chemotaxis protein methyltransferase CheR/type IV pilus assembly protein PilK|uniref:CheR family methyltransferase n=1 Tax=Oceanobacter sp. 5_MG-2023 TaxID=3062645 RepID=UPI0026E2E6CE|nr:protein-glutamate O-methyltransferase CheR [Oceanobacter sp. 5_MG-2023]MDO6682163.1 protein-glutamate O-methyltransferase CheR [Oceanobacter sp. 5_MG-2023]
MNHQSRPVVSTMPELSDDQFGRWQALLEERTGMCMPVQRRTFLQTSLGIRMREIECSNYSEYYSKVVNGPTGAIEWNTLVDRLTVQETRFFRDPDAFEFVGNYIQTMATALDDGQTLEMWSVGCSSGEEAYSLGMVADKYLSPVEHQYAVTGTDISTFALRKARAARYPLSALGWIADDLRDQYCLRTDDGHMQVTDSVRQRCCFTQVNLLNLSAFPLQSQHVIYCQNVLIYFRRWRRREILNVLAERLVPGGILVIGLGEIVGWSNPLVDPVRGGKLTAFVRKQNDSNRESKRR